MIRTSLLYALSGPMRSWAMIWNRGNVGQVQGYSGVTNSERSTNRGASPSWARAAADRPQAAAMTRSHRETRRRNGCLAGGRILATLPVLSTSKTEPSG